MAQKLSTYDSLEFSSRAELEEYLKTYLAKVNKVDEFEIYAHQINDWREWLYDGTPIQKLEGILSEGLSASKYGSAYGTMTKMGVSTDKKVIANMIDYDYHAGKGDKKSYYPTLILAFPKWINVEGKKINFTSSPYSQKTPESFDKLVRLVEQGCGTMTTVESQYTPCCWLDVLHGFGFSYKTTDNLLAIIPNKDGTFTLILPHTHWAEKTDDSYKEHKEELSQRIKDKNCDLDSAIIKSVNDHEDVLNEILYDID